MIKTFNSIIDMTDNINAQEKSFLLVLLRHMNHKTKECFPSLQTLQLKTGIKSKSTLLKTRQSLVNKGLISYQKKGIKVYYAINIVPVQKLSESGLKFNENESNFRPQTEEQKKEQKILLTEDNPYYDYIANFGWMYEMSNDFIC